MTSSDLAVPVNHIDSGHGNALSACLGAFGHLSDVRMCVLASALTIPAASGANIIY